MVKYDIFLHKEIKEWISKKSTELKKRRTA